MTVLLDRTMEMVARIDSAQTTEALTRELLALSAHCGVEKLTAFVAPPRNARPVAQLNRIYLTNWSPEWMTRYLDQNFADIDPTLEMMRRRRGSFRWADMPKVMTLSAGAQRMMNEACDFHLCDGVTIGTTTIEGHLAGFSFAGTTLDLAATDFAQLSLMANYGFVRALKINETQALAQRFSLRQRDVLRWVAEGKTDWEIGRILNISENTVDKYVRVIKERLQAPNRANAIAKAIRLGLID